MDYLAYLWYCIRQLPIYQQYTMITSFFGTLIAIIGLSLGYITYLRNQRRENTKRNLEDLNQLGAILNSVKRQFREYPEFKSQIEAKRAKELVSLLNLTEKPATMNYEEWQMKFKRRIFLYSMLDALGELENLSIRVNKKEVDLKMLFQSSGGQLIAFYGLIENLIRQMQQMFDPLTFREFEILIDQLKEYELIECKTLIRGYPYIKAKRVTRKPTIVKRFAVHFSNWFTKKTNSSSEANLM